MKVMEIGMRYHVVSGKYKYCLCVFETRGADFYLGKLAGTF